MDAEETEPKGTLDGQEKAITGNKKTRKEDYLTDKSIYTVKVVFFPCFLISSYGLFLSI